MTENPLPIIDEAQLKNGPPQLIKELFSMLALQLPQTQLAINKAFANHDLTELSNHLHRLQGSCAYCGVERVRSVARELSAAVKQSNPSSKEILDHLNQEITEVMDELKRRNFI